MLHIKENNSFLLKIIFVFNYIFKPSWRLIYKRPLKYYETLNNKNIKNSECNEYINVYYSQIRDKYKLSYNYIVGVKPINQIEKISILINRLYSIFECELLCDITMDINIANHIKRLAKHKGYIFHEYYKLNNEVTFVLGKTQKDIDNYGKNN